MVSDNYFIRRLQRELKGRYFLAIGEENWYRGLTASDFKAFAPIISEILKSKLTHIQAQNYGNSVSHTSLVRLYAGEFDIKKYQSIDPRRINTLNLLCIFLGYDSWETYSRQGTNDKFLDDLLFKKNIEEVEAQIKIEQMVFHALFAEFAAYMSLPELELDHVTKYFTGASLQKIKTRLYLLRKAGWIIHDAANPSRIEFSNVETFTANGRFCTIGNLLRVYLFYSLEEQKYVENFVDFSQVKIEFKEENGEHKISDVSFNSITNREFFSVRTFDSILFDDETMKDDEAMKNVN